MRELGGCDSGDCALPTSGTRGDHHLSFTSALTRLLTARRPARTLAILRIGIGLAALIRGLKTGRDLYLLQHDPGAVPARLFDWAPELASMPAMVSFALLVIGASASLIVGYRARLCAFALFLSSVLLYLVDQNFWANHMYFLLLLLLLLSVAESDAELSVRWLRGGRMDRDIEAWPVWLFKIQLSLVYFYTAVAKVNPTFLGGEVLADRLSLPALLTTPAALVLLSVGTVVIELFLSVALWVPKLRYWGFAVGFLLHGIVPVVMGPYAGLIVFSVATLSLYVLFVDDRRASRLVIWDDRCSVCKRWVALFSRLDWLGILRFEGSSQPAALAEAGVTADRAREEMLLWDGRRVYGGFDAVREILKVLPVGLLWAQVLALPPLRWLGARAYRAVARGRGPRPVGHA